MDSRFSLCASVVKCVSIRIWIFQVSFNCKIFAKMAQARGPYVGRVIKARESCASGERHGSCASQNSRSVVEKDLVDDAGGKRGCVDHGSPFNHQAGDLHLTKEAEDGS